VKRDPLDALVNRYQVYEDKLGQSRFTSKAIRLQDDAARDALNTRRKHREERRERQVAKQPPKPEPKPEPAVEATSTPHLHLRPRLDRPDINPVAGVMFYQRGNSSYWRTTWGENVNADKHDFDCSTLGHDEARTRALLHRHRVQVGLHGDRYLREIAAGAFDPFPGVPRDRWPELPGEWEYPHDPATPAPEPEPVEPPRWENERTMLPAKMPLEAVHMAMEAAIKARKPDKIAFLSEMLTQAIAAGQEEVSVGRLTIEDYNWLFFGQDKE